MGNPVDPSMWAQILPAAITLAGVSLGSLGTLLIQSVRQRHEDRTRFHDQRLQDCAQFLRTSNHVIAQAAAGIKSQVGALVEMNRAFTILKLVSSNDIVALATKITTIALRAEVAVESGQTLPLESAKQAQQFSEQLVNLVRSEFGTKGKLDSDMLFKSLDI